MERLTRKSLEYKDTWIADGSLSNIEGVVRGNAIDRLAELEDIFESWDIENLEELKTRLHDCQVYHLKNNSNETLIHNLKNELAELKQKMVVPKFVVGQEIWDKWLMAWKIKRVETHQFDNGNGNIATIEIYRLGHDGNDDYSCCILPADNDIFFETREKAEQALKKVGEKDE